MIWIVLPAYNEEGNLGEVLRRVRETLDGRLPYRALVINDGSTDQTAAVVEGAAKQMPVRTVSHDRNRGLAQAIRTGLGEVFREAADPDVIVIMDADNSHPPELIPQLTAELDHGADIVIASRFRPGSRVVGVPVMRRGLSRAASLLFRMLFPIPGVRDYTGGYRAYRMALLRQGMREHGEDFVRATGFSVMTEILVKCRVLHPHVREVPLILRYDLKRGKSKLIPGNTIPEYFALIKRELRRSAAKQGAPEAWIHNSMLARSSQSLIDLFVRLDARPVRFLLVGATGVGVSTFVLWVTVRVRGFPPAVGGICAAVIATFTNFLLNDRFTWGDRRAPSIRVKGIRLLRYYATTAAGNLIYVATLTALTQGVKLHVLIANVVAIGVGGALNYFMHNYWTWQRRGA